MRSFVVVDTLESVIERLRSLNEQVPRPRRLPSGSEVAGAEERAGVRLHGDLRHYLVAASDVVFGTIEDVSKTLRCFLSRVLRLHKCDEASASAS